MTNLDDLPPRAQVGHALRHVVPDMTDSVESPDDISVGALMGRMTMRGYPMVHSESDLTYPETRDLIEDVRDQWVARDLFDDTLHPPKTND